MWAELRERASGTSKELEHSYRLIRGHWIRTATLDGLITAMLLLFLVANIGVPLVGGGGEPETFPVVSILEEGDEALLLTDRAEQLQATLDQLKADRAELAGRVDAVSDKRQELEDKIEALHTENHKAQLSLEELERALAASEDTGLQPAATALRTYQTDISGDDGLEASAKGMLTAAAATAATLEEAEE